MDHIEDKGLFVISLDLELFWGVRDQQTMQGYGPNILGVRKVVPALLKVFEDYHIHATWATVGFLFVDNKTALKQSLPKVTPNYANKILSPYSDIDSIGNNEKEDPYHYGKSLMKMILHCPGQEVASHTFSHYYCLEKGQTEESFKADLEAAMRVAAKESLSLESIVFPRNQYNREYNAILKDLGFTSYRGNEASWIYRERNEEEQSLHKRGVRLLDAYINLSGHNCYSLKDIARSFPFNIPASRFLRPYSPKLKSLDQLRLKRILSGMTYAAKNNLVYHLWWHPHNFGINLEPNLSFLNTILLHFKQLQKEFGMESRSMKEISNLLMYGK